MKQILQNLGNGESRLADVPRPRRGAWVGVGADVALFGVFGHVEDIERMRQSLGID